MANLDLVAIRNLTVGKPQEAARQQVKAKHFWEKVWSSVKEIFAFLAVQLPRIYMFITVPMVVVLGPIVTAAGLSAHSLYKMSKAIYHHRELVALRKEIKNGQLPEALKKLALEKFDQQKFDAWEGIIKNAAILGVRLLAVVAMALVVASIPLAPYALPIITGLGIAAILGSMLISLAIMVYRRPNAAKEMFKMTGLKLNWNQFCIGVQEWRFNAVKKQFLANYATMTVDQKSAGINDLRGRIASYNGRKSHVVNLKEIIRDAGKKDFQRRKDKALARANVPEANPQIEAQNTDAIINAVKITQLSEQAKITLVKYFKVNPEKLEAHNEDHLQKKLREFFSKGYDELLDRVNNSKDIYERVHVETKPARQFFFPVRLAFRNLFRVRIIMPAAA